MDCTKEFAVNECKTNGIYLLNRKLLITFQEKYVPIRVGKAPKPIYFLKSFVFEKAQLFPNSDFWKNVNFIIVLTFKKSIVF